MAWQIIEGTPLAVWALLAGLMALGFGQTRERIVGGRRAILLPGVFLPLSLAGVVNAFGTQATAFAAWALGVGVALALGRRLLPRLQASWNAANDTLRIAGSWLPLALILSLFALKYAAGASLAMHPDLAGQTDFVIVFSLAYGLFSGLFAARARQLWQVRRAAWA
jgi:hypothetical protein